MNQKGKRFFRLFGVLGVAALLLGLLFGAVDAAPRVSTHNASAASASTNALLHPAAQGVTGSIQTQPGQPGGAGSNGGGATTTTTNVNVGIPGWVWIVVVLILVVIVALIASGNRGGGGGTTVIKD
jgi:hypothetical protein